MSKNALISHGLVAQNKKARHDYLIDETFEAGIMLVGSEVKSLRLGRCNLVESYAGLSEGELFLFNAYIPSYQSGTVLSHEERRPRKLLVKKKEARKLIIGMTREGMTIVALKIYFNDRGLAKVEIALGKGKKAYDKRESAKKASWKRDKARIMRAKG